VKWLFYSVYNPVENTNTGEKIVFDLNYHRQSNISCCLSLQV